MTDFVPSFEASSVGGIGAPRNTPVEIIGKLNKEINFALADPKIKAHLVEMGGTVLALSPTEYRSLLADEVEKWAKVVRFAIKPE